MVTRRSAGAHADSGAGSLGPDVQAEGMTVVAGAVAGEAAPAESCGLAGMDPALLLGEGEEVAGGACGASVRAHRTRQVSIQEKAKH